MSRLGLQTIDSHRDQSSLKARVRLRYVLLSHKGQLKKKAKETVHCVLAIDHL